MTVQLTMRRIAVISGGGFGGGLISDRLGKMFNPQTGMYVNRVIGDMSVNVTKAPLIGKWMKGVLPQRTSIFSLELLVTRKPSEFINDDILSVISDEILKDVAGEISKIMEGSQELDLGAEQVEVINPSSSASSDGNNIKIIISGVITEKYENN